MPSTPPPRIPRAELEDVITRAFVRAGVAAGNAAVAAGVLGLPIRNWRRDSPRRPNGATGFI